MFRKSLLLVMLIVVLSGCIPAQASVTRNDQGDKTQATPVDIVAPVKQENSQAVQQAEKDISVEENTSTAATVVPTSTIELPSPTQTPKNTPTNRPSPTAAPLALGPDQFPAGINPLTGLPVEDPDHLALSPALVSLTNFPVTARPQAGLSYSPIVFEMYIGEGMTRFLAAFYGDYPQQRDVEGSVPASETVGPIRSGRLPYDSLRKLYHGFLVMASASYNVLPSLNSYTNVWGSDTGDINSAMIPVTKLEAIAESNSNSMVEGALSGLRFEETAPNGGQQGNMLWIPYNFLNQVLWRFDAASGSYLRFQDNADGKTFIQATDRINQEPLTYENVVVLFATHRAQAETLIDIDLMYIDKMPALLFRDGQMYEIYWTTANAEYEKTTGQVRPIRFIDAQGNPFPLKPGQTWVEIVQPYTDYYETVDSEAYMDLLRKKSAGSGNWAVRFYPPVPDR